MKLLELLTGVLVRDFKIDMNTEISNITNDSRNVTEKTLFFAIKGYATDGHKYIKSAMEKGATAIICEEKPDFDAPFILVKDARGAMSKIASNFYGHPSRKMQVIGITGTNGKTTTTYLVKHILEHQGKKVGLIGTNQNMIGEEIINTERTTPESFEIQELMHKMQEKNCDSMVMEVSSHSLVLHRVNSIAFDVGAFTNLSQDHLDFHHTFDEYAQAKSLLFRKCKYGVINLDDDYADVMLQNATCKVTTFGIDNSNADLVAKNVELHSNGVEFDACYLNKVCKIKLGIPGKFSVYNALTAIGSCLSLGVSLEDITDALATAQGVRGRVEVVKTNTDYTVLIDYAHSPDGIVNVLSAVKGFAKGRVIAVFGCGGDRDKTKRPLMAKAAVKYADLCIVTSDNPRTEVPAEIIKDILVGMEDAPCPYDVIEERREAIVHALEIAQKDDIIVFMGKGHETYQEIHGVKYHLDEREEVLKYFA
ncbi:MAG: UDP-N-acetylmuramoyl-L-alanyl-D-glutamate--2,6-diaminopimelate ligase [Clostridia bacterium]